MDTPANQTPVIQPAQFPPLDQVTSPTVTTAQAAFYLNRKSQTLRKHACLENGPIRPIRINGRLAWRVADIKKLVGGAA
jgi:hypothetical protein